MNTMRKSIAIYGGLLALLLGGAWMRWTAEPEVELGDKILFVDGSVDDLETLKWTSDKDEAVIHRRTDARGAYLWVDYTKFEKQPKPEGDAPEGDTPEPDAPVLDEPPPEADDPSSVVEPPVAGEPAKKEAFKAGETGDKLMADFSPLLAIRKLDAIPADKLATVGLDAPKEFIEITRKGKTTALELGGEVYGTRDRYVREKGSGTIYLVDNDVLRPLTYARTRLPDRSLWDLETKDIPSAAISDALGNTLEVTQKNPQDPKSAAWVRTADPDSVDQQLETWMDKALKLKGTSYADPDLALDDLQPRYSLVLRDEQGAALTVQIFQQGEEGDWWGKSEHTRGHVKLLKGPASGLADDVSSLIEE